MTILTLDSIAARLRYHRPAFPHVSQSTRQAAVATILRETEEGVTEALFILRAAHEGDPWSGHMAFPGGHKDPGDSNLQATAERETLEEIGIDLCRSARLLGSIEPVRANPRGRNIDMLVAPYVYALEEPVTFSPNHEVAEILWGSLNDMHSGHALTQRDFHVAGQWQPYEGYGVGEQMVWGLTYRMLIHLFDVLHPGWQDR